MKFAKKFFLAITLAAATFSVTSKGYCRDYLILQTATDKKTVHVVGSFRVSDRSRTATAVLLHETGHQLIAVQLYRASQGRIGVNARSFGQLFTLDYSRSSEEDFEPLASLIMDAVRERAGTSFEWLVNPQRGDDGVVSFTLPALGELPVERDNQDRLSSVDGISVYPMAVSTSQGVTFSGKKTSLSSQGIHLRRGISTNELALTPFRATKENAVRVLHLILVALIQRDVEQGVVLPRENGSRGIKTEPLINLAIYNNVTKSGKIKSPGRIYTFENFITDKPDAYFSVFKEPEQDPDSENAPPPDDFWPNFNFDNWIGKQNGNWGNGGWGDDGSGAAGAVPF
ncbi:hypothetical protein [Endozoicomonas lisbonensis]|uniref:Uncharacterized protein n=1 Tax=Endozoicomonas lisbonensis TaxID=3120522 RepID=A0ABV2SB25_9GAMM